jgi:DNA-binding CsgD family transcriptional regulator
LREPESYQNQPPSDYEIMNIIALCYRGMAQYDSATYYFKQAVSKVQEAKNLAWEGIIKGNIGINHYLQGDYDKAVPYLKEDEERSIKLFSSPDPYTLTILGAVYLKQDKPDSAFTYLERAYLLVSKAKDPTYKIVSELYPKLANIYSAKKDPRASLLFNEALTARDSLTRQRNALIVAGAMHKIESEKHFAQVSLLNQQKKTQQYVRNTLILIIILGTAITIIFILFQKARHRYKIEAAENELKSASIQLDAFTKAIHEKNVIIDKFSEEINVLKEEDKKTTLLAEHHETISALQQLTILTEEEWEKFRLLFEKVHKGFLFRLKEKLTGLSPADIRFIALAKLHLSNKEIAGVLGIGINSVRVTKSRLKKKLELTDEENIEDVIDSI